MGACMSRERPVAASLHTTWVEVTAPQRRKDRERSVAPSVMAKSDALEQQQRPSASQVYRRKKKKLMVQTENAASSVSIRAETPATSALSNSPKSIIIPEITEHSSSSDEELDDAIASKQRLGGRDFMQRIESSSSMEPEVSSNGGVSHTRSVVGASTTLRPPHRRRKSRTSTSFPSSSHTLTAPSAEDIVLRPNDTSSTAILRRFLSPKPPPPQKATCFTQVHASLAQIPIQEDEDIPPPMATPSPPQRAVTHSSAPSDEESDPTIPTRRRRSSNNSLEIGRLSPVKLKTATSVSPQSIRVYYDAQKVPETRNPTTESTNTSCRNSTVSKDSSTAVPAQAMTNFSKLQLQIAVAAKHSLKQRVITKIDDRLQDVQQHRQLWDEYHSIQKELQQHNAAEQVETVSDTAPCPEAVERPPVQTATSVRRRRRRRFLQNRKPRKDVVEEEKTPSVEYDLEDDSSLVSTSKPPRKPRRRNHTAARRTLEDEVSAKTPRQPPVTSENSTTSTTSRPPKEHKRVASFDLHETQTWFFDFQEEFVPPKETTVVTPCIISSSSVEKVKSSSQSDLSLLSASSLEVQRQLYAEKRRLRTGKDTPTTTSIPGMATNDDTPPVRNGTRPPRDVRSTAHSVSSSGYSDYGPTKRRLPLERRNLPSAQQLLEAPNEEEKLRLAREILKGRSVTHMEVAFAAASAEEDNGSFMSDLDESASYTSLANSSFASNNDYGVKRRVRRSFASEEDEPSVVSEVSWDVSQSDRKQRSLGNTNVPVYDFQSIVQRRLDIEERLRALQAEETPLETTVPPPSTLPAKLEWTIHPKATTPVSSTSDVVPHNVVSPDDKSVMDQEAKVTSEPPALHVPKGKSDFSRLLEAVVVNRPVVGDAEIPKNAVVSTITPEESEEEIACMEDENKTDADPVMKESSSVGDPTLPSGNSLFVIEESFESNGSKSFLPPNAVCDRVACCTVLDDMPPMVSPEKENVYHHESMHQGFIDDRTVDRIDGTHETLLLADQVALSVTDILKKYRSTV